MLGRVPDMLVVQNARRARMHALPIRHAASLALVLTLVACSESPGGRGGGDGARLEASLPRTESGLPLVDGPPGGADGDAGGRDHGKGGDGAATSNLCQGLVADKAAHPMTTLSKPALLATYTDPAFKTTVRRITAVTASSGSDPVIKPAYSTVQAWNVDETRLILYKVGSGHQLYDGKTYALLSTLSISPPDVEQFYWHATDPKTLFLVEGKSAVSLDVSTGKKTTLSTFSFCSSDPEADSHATSSWSSGDQLVAMRCGSTTFTYSFVTKKVAQTSSSSSDIPFMAPSGTRVYWAGKVYDASLTLKLTLDLASTGEHSSLGILKTGTDTYNAVSFDTGPKGCAEGSLVTYDLSTGACTVMIGPSTGFPYPPGSTHVSAVARNRPGWVAVSIIGDGAGQSLLDNELVYVDTNSGSFCRVAHLRTTGKSNTHLSEPYWAEAHASPSPSGTRIIWGSDWGGGTTVDTYVVEL
jgi:hypothetical protein